MFSYQWKMANKQEKLNKSKKMQNWNEFQLLSNGYVIKTGITSNHCTTEQATQRRLELLQQVVA